jgi:hypothetical protein
MSNSELHHKWFENPCTKMGRQNPVTKTTLEMANDSFLGTHLACYFQLCPCFPHTENVDNKNVPKIPSGFSKCPSV